MNDSLGDRMKNNYENRARYYLTRRTPVIIRVDGKAFHSIFLKKPFDDDFISMMIVSALYVAEQMQGFKLGYIQSDEASFILSDYDNLDTEGWFNYNKSKMESISASLMTARFNRFHDVSLPTSSFDARSFNIPENEVANYFLWRAKDWQRNSISMYARSFFSHKELHKKSIQDIHEMLHKIGKNWANDLSSVQKNGTFIWQRFTGDRGRHWIMEENIQPNFEQINSLWKMVNGC